MYVAAIIPKCPYLIMYKEFISIFHHKWLGLQSHFLSHMTSWQKSVLLFSFKALCLDIFEVARLASHSHDFFTGQPLILCILEGPKFLVLLLEAYINHHYFYLGVILLAG